MSALRTGHYGPRTRGCQSGRLSRVEPAPSIRSQRSPTRRVFRRTGMRVPEELAAQPRDALSGDRAAVGLDDLPRDRQTLAGALTAGERPMDPLDSLADIPYPLARIPGLVFLISIVASGPSADGCAAKLPSPMGAAWRLNRPSRRARRADKGKRGCLPRQAAAAGCGKTRRGRLDGPEERSGRRSSECRRQSAVNADGGGRVAPERNAEYACGQRIRLVASAGPLALQADSSPRLYRDCGGPRRHCCQQRGPYPSGIASTLLPASARVQSSGMMASALAFTMELRMPDPCPPVR